MQKKIVLLDDGVKRRQLHTQLGTVDDRRNNETAVAVPGEQVGVVDRDLTPRECVDSDAGICLHRKLSVDKRHRRQDYAKVALGGALDLIAAQGGGVVEGCPHEIGEKRMNNSFVYNGTRTMYEQAGFEFVRAKGMKNTVMRRTIQPA